MNETSPDAAAGRDRFQRLAHASWVAPLIAVAVNFALLAMQRGQESAPNKIQATIGSVLILIGLGAGIIALIGTAKVGRRGILVPAIVGTVLNLALVGLAAAPRFMQPKLTKLEPAVQREGREILTNANLGLRLNLPNGFFAVAPETNASRGEYVFVKGNPTDKELDILLSITVLPGALSKQRLRLNPTNTAAAVKTFNWRGLEVDGLVVQETLLGTPFTTYRIQLPTAPRALQINLGAPTARKKELDEITAELLPTIDAKSNW